MLHAYVPVPPADTRSPPTSACAVTSSSIAVLVFSARSAASVRPTTWPSYPITPRTSSPAFLARSATFPAAAGSQPQRGRPTLTSITTSRTPPAAAASTVCGESTARVTRAPPAISAPSRRASRTSLASRRSWPSPAADMPSHSRIVAQVNPSCPATACRLARFVHLCALTCGRSRGPGSAAAISAMLCSSTAASTTSAGVWISEIRSRPVTGTHLRLRGAAKSQAARLPVRVDLGDPGGRHIHHDRLPGARASVSPCTVRPGRLSTGRLSTGRLSTGSLLKPHRVQEMALTADHLSIGRGRLLADTPTDRFVEANARKDLLVRSPQASDLLRLLVTHGATVRGGRGTRRRHPHAGLRHGRARSRRAGRAASRTRARSARAARPRPAG